MIVAVAEYYLGRPVRQRARRRLRRGAVARAAASAAAGRRVSRPRRERICRQALRPKPQHRARAFRRSRRRCASTRRFDLVVCSDVLHYLRPGRNPRRTRAALPTCSKASRSSSVHTPRRCQRAIAKATSPRAVVVSAHVRGCRTAAVRIALLSRLSPDAQRRGAGARATRAGGCRSADRRAVLDLIAATAFDAYEALDDRKPADAHRAAPGAFGLDVVGKGRAFAIDAGRIRAAAGADVLDGAVGVGAAAVIDRVRAGRIGRYAGAFAHAASSSTSAVSSGRMRQA